MCIICASPKGVKQPTRKQIATMFKNNPHGAGYMFARDGKVEIHKGFMTVEDLLCQLDHEKFTVNDPVVYHFRISTQAGVKPEMTHPFPLTSKLKYTEALDVICDCGIAHNGIIRLTSNASKQYSDTAYFITEYMTHLIRKKDDLDNHNVLSAIERLTDSKFAILDASGKISYVGLFNTSNDGLRFSNYSWVDKTPKQKSTAKCHDYSYCFADEWVI